MRGSETRTTGDRGAARREAGSALFVAVLMLALMGAIGIAALDTATRDRQSAGYQNRSENAFWAAEAGSAEGRALVRQVVDRGATPSLPGPSASTGELGEDSLYDREGAQPRFYGDPDPSFSTPIRHVGDAGLVPGSNLGGKQKFVRTLWQINVVGESPGEGVPVRLEVMQTRVLAQGY